MLPSINASSSLSSLLCRLLHPSPARPHLLQPPCTLLHLPSSAAAMSGLLRRRPQYLSCCPSLPMLAALFLLLSASAAVSLPHHSGSPSAVVADQRIRTEIPGSGPEQLRRALRGLGSSPPTCRSKCGRCSPCRPVHVPIQPGFSMPLEYYPEAWRCKCGNKLFMP